jgi:hypothetical protein
VGLVAAEASGLDFLEAYEGRDVVVWRQRWRFGIYCRQVAGGASATLRDEAGRLACIVGLWADPFNGEAEAWFVVGPALRANLTAAVRGMRRLLDAVGAEAAPLTVRAYVLPGGVAGARLAGWLGFAEDGEEATGLGPMRRFTRRFPAP